MPVKPAWTIWFGAVAASGLALALALALAPGLGRRPEPAAVRADPDGPARADIVLDARERGRLIYRKGLSRSGAPITAVLQGSNAEVRASLMSCASCHGEDGRGRTEGGISPPVLTWHALTDPAGARDRLGRARPAYDGPLLARAIATGINAAGRPLDAGMPRHRLAQDDMTDLIAYLEILGRDEVPGLTVDEVHIGTLLPPRTTSAGVGPAIRQTLAARFEQINREGGLYGRRLVLHAQELPESEERAGYVVDAFLERARPFALVACYLAGLEGPLGRVIGDREVPTVGAFTPYPDESNPLNRWIFYVQPGLDLQGAALARFAASRLSGAGAEPAVVHSADPRLSRAAEAVARAWAVETGRRPAIVPVSPGADADAVVRRLRESRCDLAFVLGAPELLGELLAASARSGWYPYVLAPSALSGPGLLGASPGFDGRIFLAFPHLASDQTVAGARRYRRLEEGAGLGRDHLAVRLATLAAVEALVEGLSRCGRRLDRDGLVRGIESLRQFETGFVPPLTFTPGRRVGAKGAHVLTVDLQRRLLRPIGAWVTVSDAP
ncbi:MAG: hypothetical protein QOE66_3449 [Chloroflexota bacterium]|nr:hypothetical protein [Chloroflexota bacterium]